MTATETDGMQGSEWGAQTSQSWEWDASLQIRFRRSSARIQRASRILGRYQPRRLRHPEIRTAQRKPLFPSDLA